jgi:hypothetical protein
MGRAVMRRLGAGVVEFAVQTGGCGDLGLALAAAVDVGSIVSIVSSEGGRFILPMYGDEGAAGLDCEPV